MRGYESARIHDANSVTNRAMKNALLLAALVAACSSPAKKQDPIEPTTPTDPASSVGAKPAVADQAKPQPQQDDPYLWLEEVTGDKALAWAREQNKKSKGELEAQTGFTQTRDRIRSILDSKEKTPYVTKRGNFYYNFWKDAQN